LQGLQVKNLKITKLQMKNEKLQPTNDNVSKFTSNKTHASIAQNYKLQVTNLQATKYNEINHKSQITILQLKFIILIRNSKFYNMTILHSDKLQN